MAANNYPGMASLNEVVNQVSERGWVTGSNTDEGAEACQRGGGS